MRLRARMALVIALRPANSSRKSQLGSTTPVWNVIHTKRPSTVGAPIKVSAHKTCRHCLLIGLAIVCCDRVAYIRHTIAPLHKSKAPALPNASRPLFGLALPFGIGFGFVVFLGRGLPTQTELYFHTFGHVLGRSQAAFLSLGTPLKCHPFVQNTNATH